MEVEGMEAALAGSVGVLVAGMVRAEEMEGKVVLAVALAEMG